MPQLKLPPSFTAPLSVPPKPNFTRIKGIITNIWHQPSTNLSSTSQHVYLVEILNSTGTAFLIRLRYHHRNYRPLMGARVVLVVPAHALKPIFELPNISDHIIALTPARVGVNIFPERDSKTIHHSAAPSDISYNDIIPDSVFDESIKNDEKEKNKKQMTFALLAEWIKLNPTSTFLGYVSAILININLSTFWKKGELYCMPCTCGHVVFANTTTTVCNSCKSENHIRLCLNPQILALVSDETGGFGSDSDSREHNVLVSNQAWEKLLGRTPDVLGRELQAVNVKLGMEEVEKMLTTWEQRLSYLRLTFVMGWAGKWRGGRMVVVDVLD